MPALNFKKRFAPRVESREKRQTIRAKREDGRNPKIGDTLYLYIGQRTKGCRKLGEGRVVSVDEITIDETGIVVSGEWLNLAAETKLIFDDGFDYYYDFYNFFQKEYGLPFWGLLIKWEPINCG
jgi:hypothetical protein